MLEQAGELGEAARLYESVNDFMKAGDLYERGGDLVSSARVYELAIEEGLQDMDYAATLTLLEKWAGVEVGHAATV